METKNQIDELKALMKNTRAKRRDEGLEPIPKEELLTFELLETYRRIVRQQLFRFQWSKTDAFYRFVDKLPAWTINDEVVSQWTLEGQGQLQSFTNWDSDDVVKDMALLLSRAPPCIAGAGLVDEDERVFSAVIVFVRPMQQLTTIGEATSKLLSLGETWKTENMSALCCLPLIDVGQFYPSAVSDAYLVLPYMCTTKGG